MEKSSRKDDVIVMLPAIDLGLAVAGVRMVHDACDALLDKLYQLTEKDCERALEKTLKNSAKMIGSLYDGLKGIEDHMRAEYIQEIALDDVREGMIPEGSSETQVGKRGSTTKLTGAEPLYMFVNESVDLERGDGLLLSTEGGEGQWAPQGGLLEVLKDLEAACVDFSKEEIEDLAEVLLFCARMTVECGEGLARRSLRLLEKDLDLEGASREEPAQLVVEEATAEEIAALYRSRGENASAASYTEMASESSRLASASSRSGLPAPPPRAGRYRRRQGPPSRLLWHPLGPLLFHFLVSAPEYFRSHPLKATGSLAAFLPVSGVLVFCLPGVLITDAAAQAIYRRVGPGLEVWVHDGKEVVRLTWMVTRLSVRQTYRFWRKQVKRAGLDPIMAVNGVVGALYEVVTHPVESAITMIVTAKATVSALQQVVRWAYSQATEK